MKKILILTSDPKSINYEIIKKSLFFFKKKKNKNKYFFIGDKIDLIRSLQDPLDYLNFYNIKKNKNTKVYLKECFNLAFQILKEKKASGLINLPLNKKNLQNKYLGFTEYIADNFNIKGQETMLLFNEKLSVCPGTTHIRINSISNLLNSKTIYKNINNINNFYRNIIGIKNPKISILGLNPHSGVDFKGNTEERKIIIPLIKKIQKKFNLSGPISPDSSFTNIKTNKVDCILGHYHDQVLTTFKYIYGLNAINITLGLPFLRISPDHGTAKDIIGQNKASPKSFLYALKFFEKYHKVI